MLRTEERISSIQLWKHHLSIKKVLAYQLRQKTGGGSFDRREDSGIQSGMEEIHLKTDGLNLRRGYKPHVRT